MLVFLLCFLAPLGYQLDEVLLVYSKDTPLSLVQKFSSYSNRLLVSHQTSVNSTICENQVSIIIDITLKSSYLTYLKTWLGTVRAYT